jgi:type II secretory pathway pseudopilin PulG
MRNVSRLLGQIAAVDASDGKMADSIKAIGLGYGLSESIREEPTLIGLLVRIACISIASSSLKRSAQYGDIPEPQARRLFDMMRKIDLQSHYIRAVKCERAQGLDLMDRVRHHVVVFDQKGEPVADPSSTQSFGIGSWMMDIRACADELFFMKYMDGAVAAAIKPYGDRLALKAESEPKFPRYALMSVIVMPVFTKSKEALYESMSTVAGDRVFLAVLAYKSKFGAYPSSLDDGWNLPVDPMSGKEFRYRRELKGFILYGLGKNLKDDNAETVLKNDKNPDFRELYSYSTINGRNSADMIWEKSR